MRPQCHRIGKGSKRPTEHARPLLVGVFLGHIHKRNHAPTAHQRQPVSGGHDRHDRRDQRSPWTG
jgi:hypothetical protein